MSKLYQWANLTLADTPYKHHSYSCSSLRVFRVHPLYLHTRQLSACQTFFYCYKSTFAPARDSRSNQNAKFLCCLNLQLKTDGCHLDSSLHTQGANLFTFLEGLSASQKHLQKDAEPKKWRVLAQPIYSIDEPQKGDVLLLTRRRPLYTQWATHRFQHAPTASALTDGQQGYTPTLVQWSSRGRWDCVMWRAKPVQCCPHPLPQTTTSIDKVKMWQTKHTAQYHTSG